jgi:hypothetical protein
MRHFALAALLCCGLGMAQTNRFPPINPYIGDPTGVACTIPDSLVQSDTTGGIYSCVAGQYVSVANAAGYPGVTSDGANGLRALGDVAAFGLPAYNGQLWGLK